MKGRKERNKERKKKKVWREDIKRDANKTNKERTFQWMDIDALTTPLFRPISNDYSKTIFLKAFLFTFGQFVSFFIILCCCNYHYVWVCVWNSLFLILQFWGGSFLQCCTCTFAYILISKSIQTNKRNLSVQEIITSNRFLNGWSITPASAWPGPLSKPLKQ